MANANEPLPPLQHLPPSRVIARMAEEDWGGVLRLSWVRILLLAIIAGGFITMGALFSVLLATQVEAEGLTRLLEGFGFSTGFFFVILSSAVLFTEANVVMPATMVHGKTRSALHILRFWGLAWLGNLIGAILIGSAAIAAQGLVPDTLVLLDEVVEAKMRFREEGTAGSWFEAVLSGVLANWLVGMAAFFAVMGRTIIGKYIPVFLAVTLFVAAGFQHSPANMGFFSLANSEGIGPSWIAAMGWSIIPAGIGNVVGGTLLVALPFWFVWTRSQRREAQATGEAGGSEG